MVLMKNKIVLFVTGCCVWLLSSCLGSDNDSTVEIAPNCQIQAFTLKSDSLSLLSNVKFTIDQLNNRIFNTDSLPYGTVLKDKVTGTITYEYSYAVSGMQVMAEATGDTVWWSGSDSIDFSRPVYFLVHAYDGTHKKEYKAWINIHQVLPDSMVWERCAESLPVTPLAEQKVVAFPTAGDNAYLLYARSEAGADYRLFRNTNGDWRTWTPDTLSGLPAADTRITQMTAYGDALYVPSKTGVLYRSETGSRWAPVEGAPNVRYLFGQIAGATKQAPRLAGAVEEAGALYFAAMDSSGLWTRGDRLPAAFPLTGFGACGYTAMYHAYLLLVAGRDGAGNLHTASWGTMDGLKWTDYTDPDKTVPFTAREGVMLTPYDGQLFLLGGLDAAGKAYKDIYASSDHGLTWALKDTLITLPDGFAARGFASVMTDSRDYLYLLGGKSAPGGKELGEVWRGRINRLSFNKE